MIWWGDGGKSCMSEAKDRTKWPVIEEVYDQQWTDGDE